MERMEADFLAGARDLGRDETVARDLFARMAKFAGYGFNRSHAYAYSALAFQLTYFKAHYPDVFYQVMLNYSSSSYITDALQVGFELVKPSINSIPYSDLVSQGKIILGLNHIKGLPRDLSQWIRNNRPYKNVEDFMTRLPEQYRKSNLILPLIQLGLFDELEPNRKKVEVNLEHLLVFAAELGTFFADTVFSWQEAEDYSDQDKYELEKSLIGIGLSSHPLLALAKAHRGNFTPMSDLTADSKVTVLGQIDHIKRIRTKSKGEQMAFLSLSDSQTKLEATLFPEAYRHYQDDLAEGKIFLFTGRTQDRDGRVQLLVQSLEEASLEKFWIQLANHDHDQQIGAILANFPGNCPVILRYEETKETLVSNQYRVTKSADLLAQLAPYVMKTIFR